MFSLDSFMKGLTEQGKITGNCAVVYKNNRKIYECFNGYADLEKNYAIDGNTCFRLASMTKPITAVCAMICVERGLFSLYDEVEKFYPEFKNPSVYGLKDGVPENKGKAKKPIKIINLLAHSSGIISGDYGYSRFNAYEKEKGIKDVQTSIKEYAKIGLDFSPEERWDYSPYAGLDVLVGIIEKTTGKKYLDFLTENLLKPLSMVNTTYDRREIKKENRAELYGLNDGKLILNENVKGGFSFFPNGYTCGGAGLSSTLSDYSKFVLMLANGGEYNGVRILSEDSIKLMRTRYIGFWGLTFYVRERGDGSVLPDGSFGWSGAYGSHFFIIPDENVVAVYLHSSTTFGGAGAPHTIEFEKEVMKLIKE